MATAEVRHTLSEQQARQLATVTKTVPMMEAITPRWLITFLSWVPVEAGVYRLNKVKPTRPGTRTIECSPDEEIDLPEIYVDYDEKPREYCLNAVTSILDVQTRISDLYRSPHDQIREQLRLMIEKVKERQESALLNNTEYGLLNNVAPEMKVKCRNGSPTPDDLDELIAKVWKEPSFFLAHPRAIAAFGRECTRRGVPPPTVTMFGSPFVTWRGIPLVPCDKLGVKAQTTDILLLRTGEKKQGVIGLFQPTAGRSFSQPLGTVHGHQPQSHRVIPDFSLLLHCGADRRRPRRAGERPCRQISRIQIMARATGPAGPRRALLRRRAEG